MNELRDIINEIQSDLSKEFTINLQYDELAKNLFPYIEKLYQQKNYVKNHINQLKKTIPKEWKKNDYTRPSKRKNP